MSNSPFDIPEWYTDDDDDFYSQEYLSPINVDNLPPPSPHQLLIPQIWAELIEKSLRRQFDLLGQELVNASLSKSIYR